MFAWCVTIRIHRNPCDFHYLNELRNSTTFFHADEASVEELFLRQNNANYRSLDLLT